MAEAVAKKPRTSTHRVKAMHDRNAEAGLHTSPVTLERDIWAIIDEAKDRFGLRSRSAVLALAFKKHPELLEDLFT